MNWVATQLKLNVTPDGKPGPLTYTALFEYVAGRKLQGIGAVLGKAAATYFPKYQMNTPARIAEFVAQICNETGGFRVWEENLNYSAATLLKQWPNHFNATSAKEAEGNDYMIAEIAYGIGSRSGKGRMGNNKEGDGYKYRGRGALQLTGKANYSRFGGFLGLDLYGRPELAADPFYSLLIALEFFKQGNVNAAVDKGDYITARKITNGGTIGLTHVAALRNKLLSIL